MDFTDLMKVANKNLASTSKKVKSNDVAPILEKHSSTAQHKSKEKLKQKVQNHLARQTSSSSSKTISNNRIDRSTNSKDKDGYSKPNSKEGPSKSNIKDGPSKSVSKPGPSKSYSKDGSSKSSTKDGPSKDAIASFLEKREKERRDKLEARRKQREDLIIARVEASKGRVTKKTIEQFNLTQAEIDKYTTYAPPKPEPKQETPINDRLHQQFMNNVYRSAKHQGLAKDSSSHNQTARKTIPSHKPRPQSGESSLDFKTLMLQAAKTHEKLVASGFDTSILQEASKTTLKPSKNHSETSRSSSSKHSDRRDDSDRASDSARSSMIVDNYLSKKFQLNSNNASTSSKSTVNSHTAGRKRNIAPVKPPPGSTPKPRSTPQSNGGRRYLPGDMRYTGPPPVAETSKTPVKRYLPGDVWNKTVGSVPETSKMSDRPGPSSRAPGRSREPEQSERKTGKERMIEEMYKDKERIKQLEAELMRRRQREAEDSPPRRRRDDDCPSDHRDTYYDESDEYDSELDDFIDDSEDLGGQSQAELERTLKDIYRYDKSKFKNEKYSHWDDRKMVASFRDIQGEESRSAKIARLEDQKELMRKGTRALGN